MEIDLIYLNKTWFILTPAPLLGESSLDTSKASYVYDAVTENLLFYLKLSKSYNKVQLF